MSELSKIFYKMQKLAVQQSQLKPRFDQLIEEKYGFHYSDVDLDKIIDCVDYGQGTMTFREFNQIMMDRMTESRKCN